MDKYKINSQLENIKSSVYICYSLNIKSLSTRRVTMKFLYIFLFISFSLLILKSLYLVLKKSNKIRFLGNTYENLNKTQYAFLFAGSISNVLLLILITMFYTYLEDILVPVISPNLILIFIIILSFFNLFIKIKIKSKKMTL